MSKKFTHLLKGLSATLLLSAGASAADVTVSVSPTQTFQTVEGFGGGTVYYQSWTVAHKNKAAIYDTIFTGLGMSGLRLGNWAQEENANLSSDAEIVSEAKKRLGDDFFIIMSSWGAPAELKANNSIKGSNGGIKASLKKENGAFVYDKFGAWWKRALEQYKAVGVEPDYISIQNEPDMDATYEATLFNPDEGDSIASYGKALKAVHTAIQSMDNPPKILGPEPLGIGYNRTQNYVSKLDQNLLDGFCYHLYHSGVNRASNDRYSYPDDFEAALTKLYNAYGSKPLFMTENCSGRTRQPNDAIYIAWFIANCFNYGHSSSYLHWNLLWGNTGGGCINVENPWDTSTWTTKEGFIVQCEYHGLRHFSKFVPRGWVYIASSSSNSDVVCSSFKSPTDDAYTVVLINKGSSEHAAKLSFPVSAPESGKIIQSVPNSGIYSQEKGKYTSGEKISLPSYSITTITLKAKEPAPNFSWLNPQKDTAWTNNSLQNIICEADKSLDYSVTLCWNPISEVDSASASSCWTTSDGTFSWKASYALINSTNNRWAAASNSKEWLEVTLTSPCEISQATIDETSTMDCSIKSYQLQYLSGETWNTIEKGTTIGKNHKTSFSPVTAQKFRLYIDSAGCININYFGLGQNETVIGTSSNGSINQKWEIADGKLGKGYFTIEKDGVVLSKSATVTLTSATQISDILNNAEPMAFYADGRIQVFANSDKTDYKVWSISGVPIAQGILEGKGLHSLPHNVSNERVVLLQMNGKTIKVAVK